MLQAYCDSSRSSSVVTITAIVVTSRLFVDYELKYLHDVQDTAQGELRAIMLALDLVNRNYETPQTIVLSSDCQSIVQQLITSLKTHKIPANRAYYDDWVELMKKCEGHRITVKHIKSHANARTYHTLCDYAARAIL